MDAILGKGALLQAKAFKEGFSKVFPITDLRAFSADELVMLFGNSDEDWSVESELTTADNLDFLDININVMNSFVGSS